mgnify:CR=1 FL=1
MRLLLALILLCTVLAPTGCGGGDDEVTPPQTSSIEGRVDVQGSVADRPLSQVGGAPSPHQSGCVWPPSTPSFRVRARAPALLKLRRPAGR